MGRARLLRPEGRADHGRARLLQPEGRADYGAGALIAARGEDVPPTMGRAYFSNAAAELADTFFRSCPLASCTRQEVPERSKAYRAFARRTGRLQGESMAKRAWRFFEKA